MTIQPCDVQEKCHALLVEQKLLDQKKQAATKYKYVCGWRGAGTVENCPKFTIGKGENDG